MNNDYIYDIETYPNQFTLTAEHSITGEVWRFEISSRVNQLRELLAFLWYLAEVPGARQVGFNNEGFDYPVIHYIMEQGERVTVMGIYLKAMAIINSEDRFAHMVWESDRYIEQVDLYKIHHFDNMAKSTSLKMLEFNMRSPMIEDLPFEPGVMLSGDQFDVTLNYNGHDVSETKKFYYHSKERIEFREELSRRYGRNFINFNDTKIGKEHFIAELEKAGIPCFDRSTGRKMPRQTIRESIHLGSLIFPYVQFKTPALQQFTQWLAGQTITETKGVFKDLSVTVDGFTFDFGLGGIHGSIDSAIVESSDEYQIIDLDVTSYYPSLAIVNRVYPEHLGSEFCDIYAGLKAERVKHPKGSAVNAMLKLALNGTYGDSNNKYSPFYDPAFTMTITINGQLLLCMLSEMLMEIDGLRMIQANTDGVTIYCRRDAKHQIDAVRAQWEQLTGLELEEAVYSRMFIRDVNNYIAEYEGGKLKRKGAYEYDLEWHQNQSSLVVQKAAEAALVRGEDVREFITRHDDPFDFMLRTKVPRSSRLEWDIDGVGVFRQQNITRYYIANTGGSLTKIMPPLKGKTEERRIGINKGWLVVPCNDMRNLTSFDFNLEWYITEAEKLVKPLRRFEP